MITAAAAAAATAKGIFFHVFIKHNKAVAEKKHIHTGHWALGRDGKDKREKITHKLTDRSVGKEHERRKLSCINE